MTSKKIDSQKADQLKKEAEEWKGKYLRALADYQNLEKRIALQKDEDTKLAARNLILKLLPVIDVLEKAEQVLNDQGLHLALKQLEGVLRSEQVEKMKVLGEKFDPTIMECIQVVESDCEDEVVAEERVGYTMWGKIIRTAQVKVGKRVINKKAEELAQKELQKGDYM